MLNYSEGSKHALDNCERLLTTAHIIVKNEDDEGTESFAMFLHYIAYEETAKALFCKFVELDWVSEEFVNQVFNWHKTKVFLFEEIFASFGIYNGVPRLGGQNLGDISLEDFVKKHNESIIQHRKKTNDFLYVGKEGYTWKIPQVKMDNYKELEENITKKIGGLQSILHLIDEKYYENKAIFDNFKIYRNEKGEIVIQFDEA